MSPPAAGRCHAAPRDAVLPHGRFLGTQDRRADVPGFALAAFVHDPAVAIARHGHETAHWILVLDGPYLTTARDAPPVGAGPVLVYNPPGTTHDDGFRAAAGRSRERFFSIAVSADRMAGISDQVTLTEQPTCVRQPEAVAAATRLAHLCTRWGPASPLLAEGLCLELMAAVAERWASGTVGAVRSGREVAGRAPPAWLRAARELLHDRFADGLTIGDVARTAGVHPVYLARVFRRAFGCSPGEYQRRCRLEQGAALLVRSARPVSAVALACGFADQSHFSRAFRRAYGVTPAAFRRCARGARADAGPRERLRGGW